MTGPIRPAARRRFFAMLWLSLALHALVIGFTQLPPPARVPLPAELQVEIERPAPAQAAAALPAPRPLIQPSRPLPEARRIRPAPSAPALAELREPSALPSPPAEAAPPAPAPGPVAPGPVIPVPLLADMRYYSARELDVQPVALRRPQPAYPERAEAQGVAGRVVVRLHLEADGSVGRMEVMSAAPAGAFGELFKKATLDALAGIRFKPAQRNGQPVRAVVEIPVVFEPDG